MAFLGQTFRASEMPESTGGDFQPIPAGDYIVCISGADLTPTKDDTGQYIKLKLSVLAPSHEGRVIFAILNIMNASAKAEEIGRAQLGDIMRAVGMLEMADTDELIGGNLVVSVTIKAATDLYKAGNEVKKYKPIAGASTPAQAQAMTAGAKQPAAETAPKADRPW